MSEQELLARSRQALAAFDALPPEDQKRRLMQRGTINGSGEVLFGEEPQAAPPARESDGKAAPCARE